MNTMQPRTLSAIALPIFYPLAAGVIPIMMRYLSTQYDNLTLLGATFVIGTLPMWAVVLLRYRADARLLLSQRRLMLIMLLTGLLITVMNLLYLEGLRRTSTVLYGLMMMLAVPTTTLTAAIFFPDERHGLANPRFIIGFVLSIGATLGLVLSRGSIAADPTGALMLVGATVIYVLFGLAMKYLVQYTQPLCASTVTCSFTALFFIISILLWGNLAVVAQRDFATNAFLAFYSMYGLGVTGAIYTVLIKSSGIVIASFAQQLAAPLIVALLSVVLLNEVLTLLQVILMLALLVGCALILSRQFARMASPATAA